MGADTHIQWCDFTFNGWMGCSKVSAGCKFCYAEHATPVRTQGIQWGKGKPRIRMKEAYWKAPLKWNKIAKLAEELWDAVQDPSCPSDVREGVLPYHRPRVFSASLADWLDDEVPIEWLMDLLRLIMQTPHLDWLLLTKRPENWKPRLTEIVRLIPTTGITTDDCFLRARVQMMLHGWRDYTYVAWFPWKREYVNGAPAHSRKPPDFMAMVERVSPGPRLELFARARRPGWSAWGNEVESDVRIESQALLL